MTDSLLLRQAIQNLLDNAIKYSPQGATIKIVVKEKDQTCEVCVVDDGPGVPVEQQTRLMDRFFRADNARDRNSGGFGLGLAITKAYMRVIGGTVTYEPSIPRGSTFRLALPKILEMKPQLISPRKPTLTDA